MSSPKRHVFISLLFILKCFSKPLIIEKYFWKEKKKTLNHNQWCPMGGGGGGVGWGLWMSHIPLIFGQNILYPFNSCGLYPCNASYHGDIIKQDMFKYLITKNTFSWGDLYFKLKLCANKTSCLSMLLCNILQRIAKGLRWLWSNE